MCILLGVIEKNIIKMHGPTNVKLINSQLKYVVYRISSV
jgi:hypothetical protein